MSVVVEKPRMVAQTRPCRCTACYAPKTFAGEKVSLSATARLCCNTVCSLAYAHSQAAAVQHFCGYGCNFENHTCCYGGDTLPRMSAAGVSGEIKYPVFAFNVHG